MLKLPLGKKIIGKGQPTYIIAEIGLNHQGDIHLAKKLIDLAVEAKADCVKFQKRSIKDVYTERVLKNISLEEHSTQFLLHHIKNTEFSHEKMTKLFQYSQIKGIDFLCTPWDDHSLEFLETLNLPAYKIASADMFNLTLIRKAISLHKPLLISLGMSFPSEIDELVFFLNHHKAKYVLLHCNSTYPAPYYDIHLNFIKTLQEKYKCIVGYSGHERGISVSIAAVALGAKVIEKHLTLDRNLPGPDHKASLTPSEFKELVTQIRITETALGKPLRFPSRGEYLNREALSKSLVASRHLKKGSILQFDDIAVKSPGKGTNPMKLHLFEGKKLILRDVPKDEYLLESDVDLRHIVNGAQIQTNHKWGIVGRMGDIDSLLHLNPSFVEIHLTDSDIKENNSGKKKYPFDFAVHGPEYVDDLLLDISSLDLSIRKKSVDFFKEALLHAQNLKKYFETKENIKFVIHPGGMNMEKSLLDDKKKLYENLFDSLRKLKTKGFELLVENMPPCPWYFGGQWYHASFMDASEIVTFSKKTGYGITFDISHAALYCNYYKRDLLKYVRTILPVTKYIHISDAAYFNGEGLQIGQGTIDFSKILPYLVNTDVWILSEIWQGHKFGGDGFIQAIKTLKKIYPRL